MGIKASTGLRNYMMATGSFKEALDGGEIRIYSGTEPASADDAISGTLLCTITVDGGSGGLNFATTSLNGLLGKAEAETWQGRVATSGTASFYRHCASGDTGGASSTAVRLQGSCGTLQSTADMKLSSIELSINATQNLDFYSVQLPTLG